MIRLGMIGENASELQRVMGRLKNSSQSESEPRAPKTQTGTSFFDSKPKSIRIQFQKISDSHFQKTLDGELHDKSRLQSRYGEKAATRIVDPRASDGADCDLREVGCAGEGNDSDARYASGVREIVGGAVESRCAVGSVTPTSKPLTLEVGCEEKKTANFSFHFELVVDGKTVLIDAPADEGVGVLDAIAMEEWTLGASPCFTGIACKGPAGRFAGGNGVEVGLAMDLGV